MNHTRLSIGRELLVASGTLVLSLAVLPCVIYLVGMGFFGPYDGGNGGGANGVIDMYAATLSDLLVPRLAAWIIAVGPAVCVVALRLIFKLTQQHTAETPSVPTMRREPIIGG